MNTHTYSAQQEIVHARGRIYDVCIQQMVVAQLFVDKKCASAQWRSVLLTVGAYSRKFHSSSVSSD